MIRHEVVDDGVDGRVEVAHAVRDDAAVHQEDHHPLVSRRSLGQGMIHNELKPEHKIVILKVRFQWHFIQCLISPISPIFLFKPKF